MKIKVDKIPIGDGSPLVLIAGPCVVEGRDMILNTAERIKEIAERCNYPYIFKSSYKKANRTNVSSFTTIGEKEALEILREVKETLHVPIITDVHTVEEVESAAEYADILQIPAFLCRQTDLLIAAGKSGRVVNIKKGQFLAPEDMKQVSDKVASTGNNQIMLTERGTTFGYHNLVVDMRSLVIMRETGYPVVMDATHSVQLPSQGTVSGGQPKFIKPLAKAAVAVGVDALFLEVHPEPSKALSDAGSQLSLDELEPLLLEINRIK
ncbi:MAG: 3-deoxy-8-phosphooctulonate synthase [Ignavibacteriales bacterium]|jgi:2-dehydro-3-deoxyphosphooctonate aldolase (KDO 8-P synthase)|nr:3-deoxy-8-phosphooctulonate synthase [Ignavibacteriaceae bacterium]NLH61422.1 3-deoxy-8-phosphooctulonate synthase [Ignavibacteriales bacterium]HOJ19289.1 3-deoxy-8-phosphooctulonate synthase [Ignavibacteriaceae bacterium]HPO55440.1 3-deoxy-8-phosphooctulonate synthase [Ignavibacteriaceae bacterium]